MVAAAPQNLGGQINALQRGPQIERLHAIRKQGEGHISLAGAQSGIVTCPHRGASIIVADAVRCGGQPAQPRGKAFCAAGADDAVKGSGVNLWPKTRWRDQRQACNSTTSDIRQCKRQGRPQRMADKMNVLHIISGVVKRLDNHARQILKTANLPFGRFAMARKVDANKRAGRAQGFLKRGPGLAVGGEAMQQDDGFALALAA